jgi:hypothetical protein
MNEYKVVFYNHNISDGYIQVIRGILAKSDNHAIEKIMNTCNIYKNWIISTSVIKLNRSHFPRLSSRPIKSFGF